MAGRLRRVDGSLHRGAFDVGQRGWLAPTTLVHLSRRRRSGMVAVMPAATR